MSTAACRTKFRPTIRLSARPARGRKSLPWGCAIRGGRVSIQRAASFFIGDVGENTIEEINLGQKGANYGWPNAEGPSSNPAFVNPIAFYDHSVGNSVTGGYVYNGESDGLNGQYFYTDFGSSPALHVALRRHELDQHGSHQPGPDQCRHDQQSLLVRGRRPRQSVRRRYRRRGLSAHANRRVIGPRRCADRRRGQRPAVRRRGSRQSRRRDRGGFPQRRGRRRPLHLRAGLWRGHDFRLRCGRGERGQDQPRRIFKTSARSRTFLRARRKSAATR